MYNEMTNEMMNQRKMTVFELGEALIKDMRSRLKEPSKTYSNYNDIEYQISSYAECLHRRKYSSKTEYYDTIVDGIDVASLLDEFKKMTEGVECYVNHPHVFCDYRSPKECFDKIERTRLDEYLTDKEKDNKIFVIFCSNILYYYFDKVSYRFINLPDNVDIVADNIKNEFFDEYDNLRKTYKEKDFNLLLDRLVRDKRHFKRLGGNLITKDDLLRKLAELLIENNDMRKDSISFVFEELVKFKSSIYREKHMKNAYEIILQEICNNHIDDWKQEFKNQRGLE